MVQALQIITLIALLINLVCLVWTVRLLHNVRRLQHKTLIQLEAFRVRQGSIRSNRSSTQRPVIDSRGRTTSRDTNDLPPTGRMSMAVHRKKWDASSANDGELH